jgi:hypothetical protein
MTNENIQNEPEPKLKAAKAAENRYAYYRRCTASKRGGEQCKNPALKEGQICYQHQARAEMEERRARQVRALNLPPLTSFDNLQRAISMMAQAVIENRIDLKVAGRLTNAMWLAGKLLRLQARILQANRVERSVTVETAVEAQLVASAVTAEQEEYRPCRVFGGRRHLRRKLPTRNLFRRARALVNCSKGKGAG